MKTQLSSLSKEVGKVLDGYDKKKISVGALGSHSALDIADGAKDEGFRTVVVCQKGRETPYKVFSRIIDEVEIVDRFSDIVQERVQERLRALNTIFVPHRAFTTYVSYESIENSFLIPIFGNRFILKAEERNIPRNQYYLLDKAGIRKPRIYRKPEEIDGPSLVKVPEMKRRTERAFFAVSSYKDYKKKAEDRVSKGLVSIGDLGRATIESLEIGTYFNFNYFYSPLSESLELLGVDRRLQSNLHDFVSMPARQQLEFELILQNVEVGHTPATVRESLLEKVFQMGMNFVKATQKEYPPGIIGPFALQSIVTVDLDIVVYDVSPRVPGSPIIATTSPYSKYHHGMVVSTGRRIAIEIMKALREGRLNEIIT